MGKYNLKHVGYKGAEKMKRRDLIRKLEKNGWEFLRHGGSHDIYTDGKRKEPISHQREIPEMLAKAILKRNGIH